MKTKNILRSIAIALLFISCTDDDEGDRGNWVERSVFDGVPRSSAAFFVIGNNGYMGTGYDGDDYLTDFWVYNFEGDFWAQRASFPGTPRSAASGFAIGDKGYIGTGFDGDFELADFWEYDTNTNSWTQKADFGGGVRRSAVAFAGNNAGFMGTGYDGDNDRKDFWKYDPTTDQWTELVGFGGDKRRDAAFFEINNKIYVGTGITNGQYTDDFWEFDPATEIWTRKRDLDAEDDYTILRSNAVGFSIDGLGYIVSGNTNGALISTWEYNPATDLWEEITGLEGTARQDAVAFSNGQRGFVLMGRTGSLYLDDNFELFPLVEFDDED
jgi:N-acetylneuraminic acid mutarotase